MTPAFASCSSSCATRCSTSRRMRALGFCVSVGHARFMAERFRQAGIPAVAVSGDTPLEERREALQALRERRVNVLFAVDLFNEGLDLPDVDTLLLLRPTQSATVFLQQLGRGLRRTDDKPVLTVLDLIGQQRREFRFDLKYRALTGTTRVGLERQLEEGFAYLPSGCELVLDAVAQQTVLDNVRRQLRLSRKELVAEVRSYGDVDLPTWLTQSGRELADVFRGGGSWTGLRRLAGLPTPDAGPGEDKLLRRVGALAHVDDVERAAVYDAPAHAARSSSRRCPVASSATPGCCSSRSGRTAAGSTATSRASTRCCSIPAVAAELRAVIGLGCGEREPRAVAAGGRAAAGDPADARAVQPRGSALGAGLGLADAQAVVVRRRRRLVGGGADRRVLRDAPQDGAGVLADDHVPGLRAVARTCSTGSRRTRRRSARRWGSATCSTSSSARTSCCCRGRRRSNEWGGPQAFTCLGPAEYVSHEGDRPIAITWKLRHRLSADLFRAASLTA